MLKIIINGSEVDLGNLKGITLKYNPGLFELDSFQGSYGIPFSLPENSINSKIFQFQNKINSTIREIKEYAAEIWHSGILMATGTVKASKFPYKSINCNFYIDNGGLFKSLNEKNLPEFNYGGAKPFNPVRYAWNTELDDYVIYSVRNKKYFKDTIYEDSIDNIETIQNIFINGFLSVFSTRGSIVTPFPLLWRVLKYLFEYLGFIYTDNFFTTTINKCINIFNTNNALNQYYVTVDGNEYLRNAFPQTVDIANHLPDISGTEFLKAIQNFFNIVFYVQGNKITVIDRKNIIDSAEYDDLSLKHLNYFQKTVNELNLEGVSMNIQIDPNDENVSSLPDVSGYDITETNSQYVFLSPGTPNQVYLYNAGFANYQRYMNYNELEPEYPDKYWLWYNHAVGFEPEIYGMQTGIYLGKKEFEININLSCLPNHSTTEIYNSYTNYMPVVAQQGNSGEHKEKTPFSLRLMQYRGLQNDVDGQRMPHGSYYNGTMSITAYWSYYQRWKTFMDWYREAFKETFETEFNLTASEIKNFDFSRKKKIDGNLFFVLNMDVQLTRTEIKPVKCTLVKSQV